MVMVMMTWVIPNCYSWYSILVCVSLVGDYCGDIATLACTGDENWLMLESYQIVLSRDKALMFSYTPPSWEVYIYNYMPS